MAKQVTTTFVDDIDGSPAEGTIQFAIDGKGFEIDLNEKHAQALRESFEEWTASARKLGKVVIGGRTNLPAAGKRTPSADREQNQAIRAWAQKRGLKISERGRIPAAIQKAYDDEAPNF